MKNTIIWAGCLVAIFVTWGLGTNAQNLAKKMKVSDFSLVQQKSKILIKWVTIDSRSETNYYTVEKSMDGKNFKTVAYVLGADPKEKNGDCFRCFDKITAKSKQTYYRLKQVADNGTIQYSETKFLAIK